MFQPSSFNNNKLYGNSRKIIKFSKVLHVFVMRLNPITAHKINHRIFHFFGWSRFSIQGVVLTESIRKIMCAVVLMFKYPNVTVISHSSWSLIIWPHFIRMIVSSCVYDVGRSLSIFFFGCTIIFSFAI